MTTYKSINVRENDRFIMIRRHYTHTSTGTIRPQQPQSVGRKPSGLWYSIDDSLAVWSMNKLSSCPYTYLIDLDIDMSRICSISTFDKLVRFTDIYGTITEPLCVRAIQWDIVAQDYAGVEINPYIETNLNEYVSWYRGWDVASGCVWDTSCVLLMTACGCGAIASVPQTVKE
jgi:hypothetical protein